MAGQVNLGYGGTQMGMMQPPKSTPAPIQWMPRPAGSTIPGVPPGLEYLLTINQLLVHQQVELLEAFTGWETKNKYAIKNSLGQQVYFAAEESGECMRQCCGSSRGFIMHITDNNGQEVMRVSREFKCCSECCWCAGDGCCAWEVTVEAPPGETVGYVRHGRSFWTPKYEILDSSRHKVLDIIGPCCICQCFCCPKDQEFKMYSPLEPEREIGKISKQWTDIAQEMFTKADNFGISFPVDLDVRTKATCLGAVFLIDFMHFEEDDGDHDL